MVQYKHSFFAKNSSELFSKLKKVNIKILYEQKLLNLLGVHDGTAKIYCRIYSNLYYPDTPYVLLSFKNNSGLMFDIDICDYTRCLGLTVKYNSQDFYHYVSYDNSKPLLSLFIRNLNRAKKNNILKKLCCDAENIKYTIMFGTFNQHIVNENLFQTFPIIDYKIKEFIMRNLNLF